MSQRQRSGIVAFCLGGLLLAGCGSSSGGDGADLRSYDFSQGAARPARPDVGPGTGTPFPFVPPPNPAPTSLLYVTESEGDSLAVYDPETFELVERVPAGEDPRGLSYDTQRGRVLVSLLDGTVLSFDADDLEAAPQSTAPVVDPGSLALLYDETNDTVWVSSLSEFNNIVALAASTLTGLSGSPVADPALVGMATMEMNDTGNRLYVSQSTVGSPNVAVIDAATRTLLYIVNTAADPSGSTDELCDGLAYHPSYDYLYVGNIDFITTGNDSVVVLDAAQEPPVEIGRVASGQGPSSLALDLGRNRLYATNYTGSAVQVFTLAETGTPIALLQTLPTEEGPVSVAYDAENDHIITSNFDSDTLTVYDAETLQQIPGSPFTAGDGPNSLYLYTPPAL